MRDKNDRRKNLHKKRNQEKFAVSISINKRFLTFAFYPIMMREGIAKTHESYSINEY